MFPFAWHHVIARFCVTWRQLRDSHIYSITYSIPDACLPPHLSYFPKQQMGNSPGHGGLPGSGIRPASYREFRRIWSCLHHILKHSNPPLDKTQHLMTETAPDRPCPRATYRWDKKGPRTKFGALTCMVTNRSSTITSFVRLYNVKSQWKNRFESETYKSAPMVALYWLLKRLLTYWFMRDVFPTLKKVSGQCKPHRL